MGGNNGMEQEQMGQMCQMGQMGQIGQQFRRPPMDPFAPAVPDDGSMPTLNPIIAQVLVLFKWWSCV